MPNINELNIHIFNGTGYTERLLELVTGITSSGSTDHLGTTSAVSSYVQTYIQSKVTKTITFVIDGGTSIPTTGEYSSVVSNISGGTIIGWSIVTDVVGSCVLDIWKKNAEKPTNTDSITASAKPTLSSSNYTNSSTLTGWTTTVNNNDIFTVELESVTTCKRITLHLTIQI